MGNQSLGWGGGNQHSWHLFMPFAKPQLLYKEESTSKSDFPQAKSKGKDDPSKRCSMLLPMYQTCPFLSVSAGGKTDAMALCAPFPSLLGNHAHCQPPSPPIFLVSSNCTLLANERLHKQVSAQC